MRAALRSCTGFIEFVFFLLYFCKWNKIKLVVVYFCTVIVIFFCFLFKMFLNSLIHIYEPLIN